MGKHGLGSERAFLAAYPRPGLGSVQSVRFLIPALQGDVARECHLARESRGAQAVAVAPGPGPLLPDPCRTPKLGSALFRRELKTLGV